MKLLKAMFIGVIAAILVPMLLAKVELTWLDVIADSAQHIEIGDYMVRFSWPVLGLVTLMAFLLMANRD